MIRLTQPLRTTFDASLAAARELTRNLRPRRGALSAAANRGRLEADLRRALRAGELIPYYEPIVSLQSNTVVGFEALLRWQHPLRGLVPPLDFIPLAEASSLILPIGAHVLRHACQRILDWPGTKVSVNVSRRQLADPSFVQTVKDVLAESAVNPESLVLEITESIMMEDAGESALWALKDLGVSLHMDDFGTGYSSLSCLHRFPIDVVKIDRAFIRNTSDCHDYAAVLHAIVSLAHNMGMEVIAEGIETPAQASILRAIHCDYAQGYLYSKALPHDQAAHLLRRAA